MGSRSESLSNCSVGKKRLEKSPSFASEWDEVRLRDVTELATAPHGSLGATPRARMWARVAPGSFARQPV